MIDADTEVGDAAAILVEHRIRRLPVVDENGMLVGIISRLDLLSEFLRPDREITADINRRIRGPAGDGNPERSPCRCSTVSPRCAKTSRIQAAWRR